MDGPYPSIITAVSTGLLLIAAGWLVVWIARRGASGELKRNSIAGVRTSATLSSDQAWRAAHVASEKSTALSGYGSIVGGMLTVLSGFLVFTDLSTDAVLNIWMVLVFGTAAWALFWVIKGGFAGQRAAKAVKAGQ